MPETLHLFCFGWADRLHTLAGDGLEGSATPLRVEVASGLGAVVNRLDADWFEGTDAEQRLADPAWLVPRLDRHHQVISLARHYTPVWPAPFGSLFAGQASLKRLMVIHRPTLAAFLNQVAEQEEWAIKVWFDPAAIETALFQAELTRQASDRVGLSPGRRYLHEQRLRSETARLVPQSLHQCCADIADGLNHYAVDWRDRATTADRPSQRLARNWAILVSCAVADQLTAHLAELATAWQPLGVQVEWSGPWPPYSFAPPLGLEGH